MPPKIPGLEGLSWFNGYGQPGGQPKDCHAAAKVPAGTYYYLGTDALGRDSIAYSMGFPLDCLVAAAINLVFGVIYGLVSGWFGVKSRLPHATILEILSGTPNLSHRHPHALGAPTRIVSIIITIALTSWISMSRVVRAQTIRIKNNNLSSSCARPILKLCSATFCLICWA